VLVVTALAICGELMLCACGASFVMKDKVPYAWAGYVSGHTCDNAIRVHRSLLDDRLLTTIRDRLLSESRVKEFTARLRCRLISRPVDPNAARRTELQAGVRPRAGNQSLSSWSCRRAYSRCALTATDTAGGPTNRATCRGSAAASGRTVGRRNPCRRCCRAPLRLSCCKCPAYTSKQKPGSKPGSVVALSVLLTLCGGGSRIGQAGLSLAARACRAPVRAPAARATGM